MKRTNGRGVGRAFAERQPAQNSNGQLYTDGRTIWSYGRHWPLAHWGADGKFYMNSDRCSVTTSKHRSFVISGLVTTNVGRAQGLYDPEHGWVGIVDVDCATLRNMVGAG